jgi:hypothetical protein
VASVADAQVFGRWRAIAGDAASDTTLDSVPSTATDGAGNWLTAWGRDGAIVVARSTDRGVSWGAPVVAASMAATGKVNVRPWLASDGDGVWVVTWQAKQTIDGDWDVYVSRSVDAGATWTVPIALDPPTDGLQDLSPVVATDRNGTWIVAWNKGSFGDPVDADIYFARSVDDGATWGASSLLNVGGGSDVEEDRSPTLATDGTTWIAAWEVTGPGDVDIAVARSIDGGATWTAPAPLNGDAAADTRLDSNPSLASDGLGTWIAVWSAASGNLPVHVARSTDAGVTWSAPAPLDPALGGARQFFPTIVAGGGQWVIACGAESGDLGDDGDILFATSTDAGLTWDDVGPLNSGATKDGRACRSATRASRPTAPVIGSRRGPQWEPAGWIPTSTLRMA